MGPVVHVTLADKQAGKEPAKAEEQELATDAVC
jgi:hypothetical protein